MKEKFNKKTEEIMSSLQGIKRASPLPFFFTRLEARMQSEKEVWVKISSFLSRPLIAFACILLVILINAAVIMTSRSTSNTSASQNNELATADEYSMVSYFFYEYANTKP
jgi:hypothetical protein